MVQDIPRAQTRHSGHGALAQALYEYVHDAAADAVLGIEGCGEIDRDDARHAVLEDSHRLLPDLGLATTPADCAEEGAIGVDDHLRAGLAGGRAARAGHSGQGHRLAAFHSGGDGAIDLPLHGSSIVAGGGARCNRLRPG